MKLPAIQFYPADWRKDPAVQSLSYHDRGVWFEILCLMHESEQRGKLLLNGRKMPDDALSRLLGLDKQNLTKTLTRLFAAGVPSRDSATGAIMSRRMVRDEEIRKIRTNAGKLGGNPKLLVKQHLNQKTTPSLTSSSSTSSSMLKSDKGDDKALAKLNPGQRVVACQFEDALGPQWTNDSGKWINRIKQSLSKSERVVAEVVSALKEDRIKTTPAQYAEQIWKEFA